MTDIYFVRHARPDSAWADDRTRPLTDLGKADAKTVTHVLKERRIDGFYSSPYRRSFDTVADCARCFGMEIRTDERFRERQGGPDRAAYLERRWQNFDRCEPGGETLRSVQSRNIEALSELLAAHPGQSLVLGTHGTALSTIFNYFDPAFGCGEFIKIWHIMPYVVRVRFDAGKITEKEELLRLERGY